MPVGAFGGKRQFMQLVAPSGPVYQAGTLSGNPVAMAAGLAMLDLIVAEGFYDRLERSTAALLAGLQGEADYYDIPFRTTQVGGMFGLFFTGAAEVINYAQAGACDTNAFKRFFHAMLEGGVYLAPSAFEAGFVSAAHSEEHIEATIAAAREAFRQLSRG
jgi:glutamate-1-semialdehyde 2,1-aminomutase